MRACVMFATEAYALPILRPLAAAAMARGIAVRWLTTDAVAARLSNDEVRLRQLSEARAFAPDATFCAANWAPPGIPGLKVQVFHGFNANKREPDRGHFAIRGFFDLYTTQGPATTLPFQALAAQHGHFAVVETGWPKLDPLFGHKPSPLIAGDGRPVVMFASTFSHRLSCAPAMRETLRSLIARGDRHWLLTLHPKSEPALIQAYRALEAPNARYLDAERLIDMERAADVLVCDTSSVIHEFAVQDKPVVTVANRRPEPFMLDVATPAEVDAAIDVALSHPAPLMAALEAHGDDIHPYRDGRSSERVLDATEAMLAGGAARPGRKPLNPVRRYKAWRDRAALFDR
ncbi:CDP-glycerol glycerophosphotransferase family protein [Xanthomonas sp. NCPPB 2632]|uniref:CDP-glycerol glycerophosphotransferase family protein n=1 Tax=Xanthomonas sp. NCPPB 2632 TaxID=3240912 RepID=UPI003510F249